MFKFTRLSIALLMVFSISLPIFAADDAANIDIPYKKFVLDNGLTLIVHEDHKAPIVAVNVWYHVGSKNEKPGKTGFAHLFEHLMFNGSENFDDEFFKPFEQSGATDMNGTTNNDRTNYFENVPINAMDMAFWMESDRMGHLLGAITQDKLDEQRGVVQNEKRQGENRPYGIVRQLIPPNTYPEGHPYSWTVIGSMEDLNAASLEDVHEWFKTYYGAANAVLVVAGDVNTDEVKAKVEKYFGDIPSGPPVSHHDVWIAKMEGSHRLIAQDRVPQARLYKIWNIPQWGSTEADYLDLVSDVLASGKNSRLYKRLVYEDQIATSAYAYVDLKEIAGQFYIDVMAKPGVDLATIEKTVDEELARFLKEGPTEEEMKRIKTQYFARFVRGIERIGGFGGKSDILAQNEVYAGSPDYYKKTLQTIQKATAKDLLQTARKWLSDGVFILEVHPFPKYSTIESDVDRSKLPENGPPPKAKFPAIQKAKLDNGLTVMLAERHTIPVVNFNLILDAGYAADQFALPGTANMTMSMLDEGTKNRTSLQISEELALLGADLQAGSNLDVSTVSLSALKENLKESLDLYADVILNPIFPEKEFERLKKQQIAQINREKQTPIQMALRVFPGLLYGPNHAYGNPFTGTGTIEALNKMTIADLKKFHQTWFKPNNATIIVVGDITMDEIKSELEDIFDDWQPGDVPKKNIAPVEQPAKPIVYLMNRPGAQQSVILASFLAPPKANPDEIAIDAMNKILGGTFTSRINMNLREDKHWSYGARSLIVGARGQRPYIAYAPVQWDKTSESMQEIMKELSQYVSAKPATEDELVKIKNNQILSLPGRWETMRSVSGSLSQMVQYNLPEDFWYTYPEKVRGLNIDQIRSVAKKVIHPNNMIWIVVGDVEKIKDGVAKTGIGEVKMLDADGKIVQ
ncbi:MAG TPA: insulinase family protein [Caldithrix abyssi]|uniref:Insulinase family protein n=1 Tax=Caldithrix abyssi TaxID=187145 RepID=A0A7V4TY54_CALAY|nr:insulinase family protein [Caldithrix abyssi]